MTDGVLSLDDVQTSGNDASSNASENNSGSDSQDALKQACEAIGADYQHASEYVSEHGKEDDLVEFAHRLSGNADLAAQMEQYRRMNDIHRIIRNYLRPADEDFTTYASEFYGDQESPSPGTYNAVQQASREMDGNLMFYRALFPEPDTEFWDESPVLWLEFDEVGYGDGVQDSHIYVTKGFVDEYSGVNTLEVEGGARPVPPSDSMLETSDSESDSGSSDRVSDSAVDGSPFDPNAHTIPSLEQHLEENEYSFEELDALLQEEKANAERKGAKNVIREAKDEAEKREQSGHADDGGDSGSGSGDSGKSAAETAGEMTSEGHGIEPDKVKELMDEGWTKEEIIELYG